MAGGVEPVVGAGAVGQDRDEDAVGRLPLAADMTAVRVSLGLAEVVRRLYGLRCYICYG